MFGTASRTGYRDDSFYALQEIKKRNNPVTSVDDLVIKDVKFQSGDLLRVFNSISAGDELLTIDIAFSFNKKISQHVPNGIDVALWEKLFDLKLPAKLTKPDGTVLEGNLNPFSGPGMDWYIGWSLYDFKNKSYDSLHTIEDGDRLTVFSAVTDGNIEWEGGPIELEDTTFATGNFYTLFDGRIVQGEMISKLGTPVLEEKLAQTHVFPLPDRFYLWNQLNRPLQLIR